MQNMINAGKTERMELAREGAQMVTDALRVGEGNVLVFLPGVGDIKRVEAELTVRNWTLNVCSRLPWGPHSVCFLGHPFNAQAGGPQAVVSRRVLSSQCSQ
jgi:HrpA-like RNA helicase